MFNTHVRFKNKSAAALFTLKVSCVGFLIVVSLACNSINALLGVFFTTRFCDRAGACGVSGQLMRSQRFGVDEVSTQFGEGSFTADFDSVEDVHGIAFADTSHGLVLYVASSGGLRVYDGQESRPSRLDTIMVPDCMSMGDVEVMDDGDVVVGCIDNGRLKKINPQSSTVVEGFVLRRYERFLESEDHRDNTGWGTTVRYDTDQHV